MTFVYVTNGDDWEGVYKDGKILAQGHHVTADDILRALGHTVEYRDVDYDWLADEGYLPENIEDIKFEE